MGAAGGVGGEEVGRKPPSLCVGCKEMILTLTLLRRHERSHPELGPFHCTQCGKSFSDRAGATQAQPHPQLMTPPCPHCPKAFLSASDLRKHERTTLCPLEPPASRPVGFTRNAEEGPA